MAPLTPRRTSSSGPKHVPSPRQHPARPAAGPPEIVNPIWLLKAASLTIAAALVCAWLTLCLLVYQGQWQLILHPDTNPKLVANLPVQTLRFGATETGQPRLAGLWLPASSPTPTTILFLRDGSGRLADDLNTLTQLHKLQVNLFAFDYRGFGASDPTGHPNQLRMQEDAASALDILLNTRHIPASSIIPYGAGLGASLATQLCTQHPEIPAVILESPIPDTLQLAAADPRTHLVPLGVLFHERFEITPSLASLGTPKLLLTAGPSHIANRPDPHALDALFRRAATPSFTAHLQSWSPATESLYRESISRFLSEYLPTNPPGVIRTQ